MWQVLWRIPIGQGLPIYGFGMMLFLAFLLCTWLASRRAELEGISKEIVQDLAIWLFVGGLLGARISFLLLEQPYTGLWNFLVQLPQIWEGGIVLYGSLAGGTLAYFLAWGLVYRKRGLKTLPFLDAAAPAIALGIALGRLGCFLNGCCYGQVACADCALVTPVHFPLCAPPRDVLVRAGIQTAAGFTTAPGAGGVHVGAVDPGSAAYDAGLRPGSVITAVNGESLVSTPDGKPIDGRAKLDQILGSLASWPRGESVLKIKFQTGPDAEEVERRIVPRTVGLYPTQLYESISMGLLLLVLLAYYPFRRYPGQVCAVLMVAYGVHRALNEILRDDPRPEGVERWGSFVVVIAGVLMWLVLDALGRAKAARAGGAGSSSPGGAPAQPEPGLETSPPG
jgi:phosphatidylglycerol:prolipoprotein diacylglycerol transferase